MGTAVAGAAISQPEPGPVPHGELALVRGAHAAAEVHSAASAVDNLNPDPVRRGLARPRPDCPDVTRRPTKEPT
jgi:hypothetical protein